MPNTEKLIQWIEDGKQLGKVFSFNRNGKLIWSSVGIQKWQGIYKVYVDEIEEENIKRFCCFNVNASRIRRCVVSSS